MKFAEAFAELGYSLSNTRQDWSADKADGVCLSLWTKETDWKKLVMDTRVHAQDLAGWTSKAGNRKRIQHVQRALEEFDGWVDVVKIEGEPGVSYGSASPWNPAERLDKRWRVTFLDDETGHFRMQAL